MITGYAYFVSNPRIAEDLIQPHPIEAERKFEVVKLIRLAKIDYENFTTDMLVDRQFLEDNAHLCSKGDGVIRCLLVTMRQSESGILVVPEEAWVDCAAILPEQSAKSFLSEQC